MVVQGWKINKVNNNDKEKMLKSFIERIHRLNNDLLLLIVTQFHTTQKGYQCFLDLTFSVFKPLINASRFARVYQSKINDHFTIENVTRENGRIIHEYKLNGQYHREYDQPAVIEYNDRTGNMIYQVWYKDGSCHRDCDQPVYIGYDAVSGNVTRQGWYKDGKYIK